MRAISYWVLMSLGAVFIYIGTENTATVFGVVFMLLAFRIALEGERK